MEAKQTNCSNWSAVHDFMPPRPARLLVTGTCKFPTPGYKVSLKKKEPQGINPSILILEKTVEPPIGEHSQQITDVPASFSENTDHHYTEVHVIPDDVNIRVKEVH